VYSVRFDTDGYTVTQKLVIQRHLAFGLAR